MTTATAKSSDGYSRRLRIGQLIESDGPGGAETVVVELSDGLSTRGHEVIPVVPERGEGWLQDRLDEIDVGYACLSVRRSVDLGAYRRLQRLVHAHELDIVHSHEFTMTVYAAAACAATGAKHVATMHGGGYYQRRLRRRWALGWAARRSARFVAVSGKTAEELHANLRLNAGELEVVYNGVPLPRGRERGIREDLGVDRNRMLLLSVGSLYRVKGHDVLLRALARLPEAGRRSVHLAVAGRGAERSALGNLARELKIKDFVTFLGQRSDVSDLLAAADAFVLPSRSEGLPLALLEAMGAGLPIIASDVGGVPEVVVDGTHGLLVPPEDEAALAEAVARLLGSPELRSQLGRMARSTVLERFTLKAMVARYERLYRSVLTEGTRI